MHTRKSLASPEQIRAFIEKEYPTFAGCEMSIGLLDGVYRVMVKDQAHVCHTINIPQSASISGSRYSADWDLCITFKVKWHSSVNIFGHPGRYGSTARLTEDAQNLALDRFRVPA